MVAYSNRKGIHEKNVQLAGYGIRMRIGPNFYFVIVQLTPSFQHRSSYTVKVGWTDRGTLFPSLALFSFPSCFPPSSHPASPFPGPFLPVSLYYVHSLSETPLNRHRNVYVKLTQDTSCMHTNWSNPVNVPVTSFRNTPKILVILVL